MDSPRLARQWRRDPEARAESTVNLSRDRGVQPAGDEVTEAQPAARDGAAEPTSKVLASRSPQAGGQSIRHPPRETTHPIDVPELVKAARPVAPVKRMDDLRVAEPDNAPSELVQLVLPGLSPRNAASLAAGDVLAERYCVIERVAESGMGVVCKALDRRREAAGSPRPWVALKFARSCEADETSAHLRQEFLTLSQLNHPNIVSVFDFAHDRGLDFLVMEWLEGETLADLLGRITSKRLALGKAEDIVRSVASALAHAHDLGLVHGDVKPSNIFLTKGRGIKLLDFGSCPPCGPHAVESNWATRTYASVQVLQGKPPCASDDVHALGVTAYCLLSGEKPFAGRDACEASEQGILPRPLPADSRDRWPAVEGALKSERQGRPADAGEFLREFDEPPKPDSSEEAPATPLSHVGYGAIAIALLITLVAWSVGTIGGGRAAVEARLADGRRALQDGQLVQPANDSAFAHFSSVLEVAPRNREAQEGLRQIAESYLTRSREALARSDARGAVENLKVAERVMPEHFGIAIAADLIERYGRDLLRAAAAVGADEPARAEAMLERAAEVLPAGDAAVAEAREEILRATAARELENLLVQIDERILAEQLLVPPEDSAVRLLDRARELAGAEDRRVALAADRVGTALIFQSLFAVSNGQLQDAARFLEAAKGLGIRHIALARAEYELARARHEALASRRAAGN